MDEEPETENVPGHIEHPVGLSPELEGALAEVMVGADRFGHRQHLHLAWLALNRYGEEAEQVLTRWLFELALRHDMPDRFNVTRTNAWGALVRYHHAADTRLGGFDDFIRRNPQLLDGSLLGYHWSAESLDSEEARTKWVDPDLAPIPVAP